MTLWFSDDVLAGWRAKHDALKVGRPFVYSDAAIECLLTIRELFQLPYRQTEGFGRSLLALLKVALQVPDYSSLAKRASRLRVALNTVRGRGAIDVIVDSTGLKVFGEVEWKTRTRGKSKRRTWRKLHLSVNPDTREILAEVLTENSGHDADQVKPLCEQTPQPIKKFYGDGAYDKWKVYDELKTRGVEPVIPPQHNAKIKRHVITPPVQNSQPLRQNRAAEIRVALINKADSDYQFRRFCEEQQLSYVVAISSAARLYLDGRRQTVGKRLKDIPANAWRRPSCGAGSKGERQYDWAFISWTHHEKETHNRGWLVRRSLGDQPEHAYYFTFAPVETTVETLVRIAGSRWAIEECFEQAKQETGLDEYEVRSWIGWHRHITLSMLAHATLVVLRERIRSAPSKTVSGSFPSRSRKSRA